MIGYSTFKYQENIRDVRKKADRHAKGHMKKSGIAKM